jgi:hypothetical protein
MMQVLPIHVPRVVRICVRTTFALRRRTGLAECLLFATHSLLYFFLSRFRHRKRQTWQRCVLRGATSALQLTEFSLRWAETSDQQRGLQLVQKETRCLAITRVGVWKTFMTRLQVVDHVRVSVCGACVRACARVAKTGWFVSHTIVFTYYISSLTSSKTDQALRTSSESALKGR